MGQRPFPGYSTQSHTKKRPILEKFVDEAFLLVTVNLEQFA